MGFISASPAGATLHRELLHWVDLLDVFGFFLPGGLHPQLEIPALIASTSKGVSF